MRDPSTKGPDTKLMTASKGQGTNGVGGQAHTYFLAYATTPLGVTEADRKINHRE